MSVRPLKVLHCLYISERDVSSPVREKYKTHATVNFKLTATSEKEAFLLLNLMSTSI